MNREIKNIIVCNPIEEALVLIEKNDFIIRKQELRDYHFNEFYFLAQGNLANLPELPNLIKTNNTFSCKCHWSSIEIIEK